jgi:hypothetical protein
MKSQFRDSEKIKTIKVKHLKSLHQLLLLISIFILLNHHKISLRLLARNNKINQLSRLNANELLQFKQKFSISLDDVPLSQSLSVFC